MFPTKEIGQLVESPKLLTMDRAKIVRIIFFGSQQFFFWIRLRRRVATRVRANATHASDAFRI